ncbi:hypothetical protein [Rhodovarius crocodyli]|uniref:hypothetical protein n=1 Tax=Rhodovarius crocodyli TaxID=1979269 RepID=UPI0013E39522|nr:hypothetical protein [Rhodovarius crocodyli]
MARCRWTPELIGDLRMRVMRHNQTPGTQKVRLEELKKAFAARARGAEPMAAGMKAVDRLLLAKADDDQPRESNGRFARSGAPDMSGQGRFYRDVATPFQHRQLREQNAGYEAANQTVIPETRYGQFLPGALAAASLASAAVDGATAKFGRKPKLNLPNSLDALRLAARAATLGRENIASKGLKQASRAYNALYEDGALVPAKLVRRYSDKKVARIAAQPTKTAAERFLRSSKILRTKIGGRVGAALTAAAFPGAIFAPLAYGTGQAIGPAIDSAVGGRTVNKANTVEDLAKRWKLASLTGAARRALTGFSPSASPLVQARQAISGPAGIAANRVKRHNLGTFGRVGTQAAAAAAGAGAAGTAAWAAASLGPRVFYRDEDGKFTSKEKAVITGVAGVAGAAAGLLAGRRAVGNFAREAQRRATAAFEAPATGKVKSSDGVFDAMRTRLEGVDRRAATGRGTPTPEQAAAANRALDSGAGDRRNLSDMLAARMEARTKGATMTRAEAIEARSASGELARLYGSKANRTRRQAAIAAATKPIEALTVAARQGPAAWGAKALDDVERSQIEGLMRLPARGKPSWWDGVDNPRDVRRAFFDTWNSTGSLDQAIGKLPKAKQGDLKAIRSAVDEERTAFAGRVTAWETQRVSAIEGADKAVAKVRELAAKKTKAAKALDDLNAIDAATHKTKAARAAHADAITAAENELVRADKALAGAKEASARAERTANHASRLDPAGGGFHSALAEASDEVRDALRPRNPFKQGSFLEGLPSPARLKELRDDATKRALLAENTRLVDEAMKRGARVRQLVDDVATETARISGTRTSGPVQRQVEAVAARIAPYMESMQRDVRMLRGGASAYVNRLLGDGPANWGTAARNARAKVERWVLGQQVKGPTGTTTREGGAWNWAKRNKGAILTAGAAAGVLDYSADGRVNLNWRGLGRFRDDPLSAADSARKNTGAFFRIYNPGAANEAVLTGITLKGKDGKETFVTGRITRADGSEIPITTGAAVDDITRQFNRGPSGDGGGGGGGNAGGEGGAAARASALFGKLKSGDAVKREEIGGETFQHTGGQNTLSKDDARTLMATRDQFKTSMERVAEKIGNNVGAHAGDFYRALGQLMGEPGRILTINQMRQALVGDKGLFGTGSRLNDNLDAKALQDKLSGLAGTLPAPQDAEQAKALRRAMRLLGGKASQKGQVSNYSSIDSIIDRRMSKSAPGTPPATHAPAPSPRTHGELDDETLSRLEADLRPRYRNELSRRGASSRGGRPDADTERLMAYNDRLTEEAATLFNSFRDELRGTHSAAEARRLAAEQTWSVMTASLPNRPTKNPFAKAAGGPLAKALDEARAAAPRRFDEAKISRHGKGDGQGGEFAPRGGGRAAREEADAGPQRRPAPGAPPAKDERGYFEPVRLGATVGGTVGSQAAWELFNRYAPKGIKLGGTAGRFVLGMLASVAGGVGGAAAGEAAGRKTYDARGEKAPGSYEQPQRDGAEEVGRGIGGFLGGFAGLATASVPGAIALGTAGSLAGEELFGRAAKIARERFGVEL